MHGFALLCPIGVQQGYCNGEIRGVVPFKGEVRISLLLKKSPQQQKEHKPAQAVEKPAAPIEGDFKGRSQKKGYDPKGYRDINV